MVGGSGHNQASTTRRGSCGGNQWDLNLHDAPWRIANRSPFSTARRGPTNDLSFSTACRGGSNRM
jgi:hypothetical protein